MSLTKIEQLIQLFRGNIPTGPGKAATIKAAVQIRIFVENFKPTGTLMMDFANFDEFFYDSVGEKWIDEMYNKGFMPDMDDFVALFGDFRNAAHQVISGS